MTGLNGCTLSARKGMQKTHEINDLLKSNDVTLYYFGSSKKGENIHTFKAFPSTENEMFIVSFALSFFYLWIAGYALTGSN